MRGLAARAGLRPSDLCFTCAAALAIVATNALLNVSDGAGWAEAVTAAVWVGCIVLFVGLAVVRRGSLAESGAWLIVLGAVIAIGVISVNEFIYPFTMASGVAAHTRFHFFVAGSYALAAIASILFLALGPLREGRAWAWWAVGAVTAVVFVGDVVAYVRLYPHLLHFLIIGSWVAGLALAGRPIFRHAR